MKKVNVLALTKFHLVMGGLVGLLCGILYSFGGLVIDALVSVGLLSSVTWETPGLSFGTVLAFGALIGMPLIGAAGGLLLGIAESILYVVFAKWLRRLSLNFERD